MTMTKDEALKMALEALEEACELIGPAWAWRGEKGRPAITAIKEALAQPEQEPVAWDNCQGEKQCRSWCGNSRCVSHWNYTTPPQRTWVGLTAKEKHEFRYSHMTTADFIEDIEAKLKDKNT